MRLPHVTIEYREEESFAIVGKMSAECIFGFGLHWAWTYLVMYGGNELFQVGVSSYLSTAFLVSLAMLALTLLSYAVFFPTARELFRAPKDRNRNRLIAASTMFVGTALMIAASHTSDIGLVFCVVSGILTGFGSAVLLMSFGVSFSAYDLPTASISTALSFLFAVIIYIVVVALNHLSPILGVLLCLAMPLAEVWCLKRCSYQLIDSLEFARCTLPVRTVSFGLRVGIPFLLIGLVLGFVRGRALVAEIWVSGSGDYTYPLMITIASVASCALIVSALLAQRQTSHFMFRTMLPLVAALIALAVTPLGESSAFSLLSTFICYLLLEAGTWITLSDISQRYRISPFSVFGFGRGAMAAGTFAWIVFWELDLVNVKSSFDTTETIVLMLVLLACVRSALPTFSELSSTLIRCSTCPAFLDEENTAQIKLEQEVEVTSDDERSTATQATTAKAPAAHTEAAQDAETETAVAAASASSTSPNPAAGATSAPKQTELAGSSERAKADQEASSVAQHTNRSAEIEDADAPVKFGRFKRKCLFIADTYLLSRKETEVLFLLAKGHNSSAIQKSLFISSGTANTHMRNIYRKLDVHSQQELISLVESADDSDLQ